MIFSHIYLDSDCINIKYLCIHGCLLIHLNVIIQYRHDSFFFFIFLNRASAMSSKCRRICESVRRIGFRSIIPLPVHKYYFATNTFGWNYLTSFSPMTANRFRTMSKTTKSAMTCPFKVVHVWSRLNCDKCARPALGTISWLGVLAKKNFRDIKGEVSPNNNVDWVSRKQF